MVFCGARLQAEERVGKIRPIVVELDREEIRFRLAHLVHELRMLLSVMDMVRERTLVVEELGVHGPAVVRVPEARADDGPLQLADRVPQGHFLRPRTVFHDDEAQALVRACLWAVVSRRGRREPPLVDASAVAAQRVIIGGMELDSSARNAEGARHPVGRQA